LPLPKGVGRKIFREGSNGKKTKKIALVKLFQRGGGATEKGRKIDY